MTGRMKRIVVVFAAWLMAVPGLLAQGTDLLSAKKGVTPNGYDFWVYTPEDYYYSQEFTPLVLFLHGSSLCGRDLNRALRYGPMAAVRMGLDMPALVVTPQNPGGAWNPKKLNDVLEWLDQNGYVYDLSLIHI